MPVRSIARRYLRAERAGHTLESRALVHEAYLRLFKGGPVDAENRSHFLGIVSRVMRQVLVDHARQQLAAKRDGGCRVELEMALELPAAKDVIAVDDALTTLATLGARLAVPRTRPQHRRLTPQRWREIKSAAL